LRESEELLIESENKLWSIVNATQESIYMFDREGRFTMSNSTGLKRLNNISEKDLIGHHFSEFMPVELARHRQEKLDIVFKTGKPLEFEDVRNGITFHNNFFPLLEDKKVSHVVTYSTDITDRKKAEKELESTKDYLENLINYANAPIIVWNPDTRIQLFNHAFEHLTGYSSSEVQGKKLYMLFPQASLEESNAKIKDALTENWKTIEIPILTKNNEIKTVLWNSANIYDSDKKTVLSTIAQGNDITERIIAEQNVKERTRDVELANFKLKQELKERFLAQEALRKSEAQLKELNATKDKFFNIVAHDLKNPFTSLIGSSELLSQNIDQMDNEEIKTLAFILNDASKSGYAILQNLLDWSRSQTGLLKFNPEEINLRNLIDEHIQNLEQISANKEIKLYSEVKDNLFIYSDKNMIKTIMRNLLSNAIKYSYRCGKVIVRADVDDRGVIVSVKDNGIGIPEENIKNIFRIDVKYSVPGTEKEQGTGLGLKLCKEFVEKQGGKIWVESIENKGSEFKFSIPVKEG
jgi:PAS domain S-box-containing protein